MQTILVTPLVTPFPAGSKESLFSCTLTASEEAMAALEEVVLYAFQQCVYYLSKVCAAIWLSQGLGVGGKGLPASAGRKQPLLPLWPFPIPGVPPRYSLVVIGHGAFYSTAMSSLFAPAAPVLASISPRGGSCWASF